MPNKNFNNMHKSPPNTARPENGVYDPSPGIHPMNYSASSMHDSKGVSSASPHARGRVVYNPGAKGNNASNKGGK